MDNFDASSLALDKSCDVSDTAQLLIFVRGIMKDYRRAGSNAVNGRDDNGD